MGRAGAAFQWAAGSFSGTFGFSGSTPGFPNERIRLVPPPRGLPLRDAARAAGRRGGLVPAQRRQLAVDASLLVVPDRRPHAPRRAGAAELSRRESLGRPDAGAAPTGRGGARFLPAARGRPEAGSAGARAHAPRPRGPRAARPAQPEAAGPCRPRPSEPGSLR